MKLAKLQMEIQKLEEKLETAKKSSDFKTAEIDSLVERLNEKSALIEQLEERQKKLERSIKEQEMQNSLLNELREKDTKQHIKALTDLDVQLKKKSSDADKVSHFLEQLRVKQERIQELESQFARVERQANQERQTFDRQTHETWLNARKIEKELKESRAECSQLQTKLHEAEALNKSLSSANTGNAVPYKPNTSFISPLHQQYQQLQQNSNSSMLSHSQLSKKSLESDSPQNTNKDVSELSNQLADAANSLEGSLVNESINKPTVHTNNNNLEQQPLQVDTLAANASMDQNRPSSRSSNHSGVNMPPNFMGMPPPYGYMRPPMPGGYRFPYPNPQMAAFYHQQQQQQQQQNPDGTTNPLPNPSPNASMMAAPYPPNFQSPSMLFRMQQIMSQQQQQYMQHMQQHSAAGMTHSHTMPPKSNASSQQPSPRAANESTYNQSAANSSWQNSSLTHSATFPPNSNSNNFTNDTSINSINFNDTSTTQTMNSTANDELNNQNSNYYNANPNNNANNMNNNNNNFNV